MDKKIFKSQCLLVDFNSTNRFTVKCLLEKYGFIVNEAVDGKELIKKINNKYDIVILELDLPKIDGIFCCEILKNYLNYQGIIIGLTSFIDSISLDKCAKVKMDKVFAKPIDETCILKIIEDYFNKNNKSTIN